MKTTLNIYNGVRKVSALLLLLLLFSATVIQTLHTHPAAIDFSISEDEEAAGDCSICDHYYHQANAAIEPAYPPVFDTPLPAPVVHHGRTYARIYKFTLQGFSNKGPPHPYATI
ncbi:hypothetical protein MKQ70_16230 [Chitinophaga sedimenti]|uniref:hypothetical protein n=1 Tax=Chitinophaga sedimenti TaxID=2033606 RepID=UPI002006CC71|nr:hypothetical protein [Chitinophaga sedimenti]MCK7556479.1 hypothetical protein [Chitinophaga sedimenti]